MCARAVAKGAWSSHQLNGEAKVRGEAVRAVVGRFHVFDARHAYVA